MCDSPYLDTLISRNRSTARLGATPHRLSLKAHSCVRYRHHVRLPGPRCSSKNRFGHEVSASVLFNAYDKPEADTSTTQTLGQRKFLPSYYDRDGNFRGVENGAGLDEDGSLLQMRWSVIPRCFSPYCSQSQVEAHAGADGASSGAEGSDHQRTPGGKNDRQRLFGFHAISVRFDENLVHLLRLNRRESLELGSGNIELVLTHPNGWGSPQHSRAAMHLVTNFPVTTIPEQSLITYDVFLQIQLDL